MSAALITENDGDDDIGGGSSVPRTPPVQLPGNEGYAPSNGSPRSSANAEPEYEIVDIDEPGEQTSDRRLSDEGGEDTYLARQARQQEVDQRNAQRRRERDETPAQRRARQAAARQHKDTEIAELRAQNLALMQRMNGIEPRLQEIDLGRQRQAIADMDRQINEHAAAAVRARHQMSEAMVAGDADAMTTALDARDQAIMQGQQLQARRNYLVSGDPTIADAPADGMPPVRQTRQAPQGAPPAAPSPATQRYVSEFMADNADWYRPDDRLPNGIARDDDTHVALSLDAKVAREGYNPETPAYWDRLNELIAQYLPHRAAGASQDRNPAPQRQRQPAPERRGPQVGGSTDRAPPSGRRQVALTPSRKAALVEAGVLDRDGRVADRKRFERIVSGYTEWDRDNAPIGRA